MKTNVILSAIALMALLASHSRAFGQDQKAEVVKSLEQRYPLTQPNGDNTQLVSTGALLLLQKNFVDMAPVAGPIKVPLINSYKDGKISSGFMGHVVTNKHTFVRGETMWVTNIALKDDGIYFDVLSEPINEVRYRGVVKLPFPKGHAPTPEQAQSVAAEVFSVQAPEQTSKAVTAAPPSPGHAGQNVPQAASPVPSPVAPPPVAPPPVAPPPPPPDQVPASPPTISINETKQEVEAALGKPDRTIQANRKEIYLYKDRKVTFVDGKVTRVD